MPFFFECFRHEPSHLGRVRGRGVAHALCDERKNPSERPRDELVPLAIVGGFVTHERRWQKKDAFPLPSLSRRP